MKERLEPWDLGGESRRGLEGGATIITLREDNWGTLTILDITGMGQNTFLAKTSDERRGSRSGSG